MLIASQNEPECVLMAVKIVKQPKELNHCEEFIILWHMN